MEKPNPKENVVLIKHTKKLDLRCTMRYFSKILTSSRLLIKTSDFRRWKYPNPKENVVLSEGQD